MNAAGRVAAPFVFETVTSTVDPDAPGGSWHVRVVSFTTNTFGDAFAPKVTEFVPAPLAWKPLPVRVISPPPAAGPVVGSIIVSVGSAL